LLWCSRSVSTWAGSFSENDLQNYLGITYCDRNRKLLHYYTITEYVSHSVDREPKTDKARRLWLETERDLVLCLPTKCSIRTWSGKMNQDGYIPTQPRRQREGWRISHFCFHCILLFVWLVLGFFLRQGLAR
jgi:hypothetical protein